MSGNPRKIKKAIKSILDQFVRATLFLILSCGGPFILACALPLFTDPLTFMSGSGRVGLLYALPSIATLIVDLPTKMPAYMGFFLSKAISLFWARLKQSGTVPRVIAFEKEMTFALLAGLIGLISVKRGQIAAAKAAAKKEINIDENVKATDKLLYGAEGGPAQQEIAFKEGKEKEVLVIGDHEK